MRPDLRRLQKETSGFSPKRGDTLAADLDFLLGDLCRPWGFCTRLSGHELSGNGQLLSADAFATAMLTAKGFQPGLEVAWHRRFKRVFIERYGSAVSAGDYAGP